MATPSAPAPGVVVAVAPHDEQTPLLAGASEDAAGDVTSRKRFYRARPLWLVPFAVTAALVRGMTLAPRVQVYTQLACQAVYHHSPLSSNLPSTTPSFANISSVSIFTSLAAPHQDPCKADPAVQAKAASLQMLYMLIMGITSALSTTSWGHFGERRGRLPVLALSTVGLVLTDLTFALLSSPQHHLSPSAGTALLMLAPFIEGSLGGWASLQGATMSYLSDCTSTGRSRAQVFARFTGVFYAGFALGPAIGAYLLRHPLINLGGGSEKLSQGAANVAGVFAVAAICSALNCVLALFVFPESLRRNGPAPQVEETTAEGVSVKRSAWSEFFGGFARAGRLFAPRTRMLPGGRKVRDASLTLLAASLFLYLLASGIFQIKYLYAQHVYGWGSEELSWYIFLAGGLRSLTLLFLVPAIISLFKPKRAPSSNGAEPDPNAPPSAKEIQFDLSLARASLALDVVSHTLVVLAPSAVQPMFVAFSVVSSLSAGAHPTAQSLALGFAAASPDAAVRTAGAGAVFGATAALMSAGQMIAGPLVFGALYARTVAVFPKAVFAFAGGTVFVALLFLSALQPPKTGAGGRKRARREERGRGRSRTPKDLRSHGLATPRSSFGESVLSDGEDFGGGPSGDERREDV